ISNYVRISLGKNNGLLFELLIDKNPPEQSVEMKQTSQKMNRCTKSSIFINIIIIVIHRVNFIYHSIYLSLKLLKFFLSSAGRFSLRSIEEFPPMKTEDSEIQSIIYHFIFFDSISNNGIDCLEKKITFYRPVS
ncbi:hypothetical protein PFISCL1PPCAC_24541, partial [Pristionchus fissidentatus]